MQWAPRRNSVFTGPMCSRQRKLWGFVHWAHTKAAMKLVIDKGARAVGAAGEPVREPSATGENALREIMPVQWAKARCQPIFDALRNCGARPPRSLRECERMACSHEAPQREGNRGDRSWCSFCLRLSRVGIGVRRDEIAHARTRGGRVAPVDRDEQRACWLVIADNDLHDADAVCRGDPCKGAVDKPGCACICWMHLHKRLGPMHGQPRAQAGARHAVPLIADTSGIEPEGVKRRRFFLKRGRLGG